jgi:hypothetical protein
VIPRWLPFVALFLLTVGWFAVAWTLKAMILDRRARRLAAEAAALASEAPNSADAVELLPASRTEGAGATEGQVDSGHLTHDL